MTDNRFVEIRRREGEYWDRRFRTVEEVRQKKIEDFTERADRLFDKAYRRIDQKLHLFFAKFSDVENVSYAEAKRLLTDPEIEDFKMELEEYIATAAHNARYYEASVAKELEKASLKYRVTRLEAMEYQLKAILAELFSDLSAETDEMLAELYQDQYSRTAFEVFRGVGVQKIDFSIPDKEGIELLIRKPWRADGADFSERYDGYRVQLVSDLSDCLSRVIINGEGYQGAARELEKKIGPNRLPGTNRFKARRLIHTEAAYFSGIAQNECFKELGVKKYQFRAELNLDVCDNCQDMDGEVFDIKDRRVGVNAPPMHPFCVLPDTLIYAPDAQALTRSYYSGDVIKISAANGRSFTVTPNHIMLTSRGWVRAKFLVEGDQVIYYSGWDECTTTSDPADDNSIPTIEELFTSFTETGFSATSTMPASSIDFKGDVVENSKIDIVFINSFLRNKLNPAFRKLVSDSPLISTAKTGKIAFNSSCTVAEFLMGTALASDGVMSGLDVSRILLSSSFTHHKSVSFGVVPDYNARLFKTAINNISGNTEFAGKSVDTHSISIKSNDLISGEIKSGIGFNTSFIQNVADNSRPTIVELIKFFNGFPGLVKFYNIVRIDVFPFSGHVYDASSLSTSYICNGFISSNCRCVSVPYVDDRNVPGYVPELRSGRDSRGKSVLFREDITYKEWYEQYGKELEEKRKK